jgi:hypothetical protein
MVQKYYNPKTLSDNLSCSTGMSVSSVLRLDSISDSGSDFLQAVWLYGREWKDR